MNREEFETLFLILYKKWKRWGTHTSTYGVGWDIWQYQQKIIDELKAEIQENESCCWELQKQIDELNLKLAIKDDAITALNLTIDTFKALNPDVPCPVCGGEKGIWKTLGVRQSCPFCNGSGTVPLTKEQEYRIRELEEKQ